MMQLQGFILSVSEANTDKHSFVANSVEHLMTFVNFAAMTFWSKNTPIFTGFKSTFYSLYTLEKLMDMDNDKQWLGMDCHIRSIQNV